MKKIELMMRKSLRNIFNCISLTAVAFVFQACYGPGPDCYEDIKFTGTVISKTTNLPVKGIRVTVNDNKYNVGITDEKGNFDFYAGVDMCSYSYYNSDNVFIQNDPTKVKINFFDIDGVENGCFADSTIIINPVGKNKVSINVELEEKKCE